MGEAVVEALTARDGEIRAFVSTPATATALKASGVKVALGDVSDGSHVGGAALHCFSVVFVTDAASDPRPRAFAESPQAVFAAWGEAVEMASPERVIWVAQSSDDAPPAFEVPIARVVVADRPFADVAAEVVRLDDQEALPGELG